MTLSEFKAWLEGFTEAMDGAPNADQWERIKGKIAGVKETPQISFPSGVRDHGPRWPYPPPQTYTVRGPLADAISMNRANGVRDFNQTVVKA